MKKPPKAKRLITKVRVTYSRALADRICVQLAEGKSLNSICSTDKYPAESVVRGWALDDKDGFSSKYTRARQLGYERLAEEILAISDTPMPGVRKVTKPVTMRDAEGDTIDTGEVFEEITEEDMLAHRKLQVDTRKWLLSKVLPKVYGDRQQVDVNDITDTASILAAARKRSGKTS